MRYQTEQRLRMIDFLLVIYGYVNRGALTDYYGISMPQATNDFRLYIKLAPDNMEYSKTDKIYKKTRSFKRLFK